MKTSKVLLVVTVIAITAWSCQKSDSKEPLAADQNGTVKAVDLAASIDEVDGILDENLFYAINFLDFNGITGKGGDDRSGFFSSCVTFTMETLDGTTTITIGFEPDCTDRNGNVFSGTATFSWTKTDTSGERSVSFTDFAVNGYVVNGSKTFSFASINANGNPEMSSTVDISVLTDAGTITKVGSKLIQITAGGDTDSSMDDEVTTTGSFTYTGADGMVLSMTIDPALVKPAECKYIASGVKAYTLDGTVSTLDYGDGSCDEVATLTEADGTMTEITLRKGRRDRGH